MENLSQGPIIHRPHPYRVARASRISVAFAPQNFSIRPLPCPESPDDRSGLGKWSGKRETIITLWWLDVSWITHETHSTTNRLGRDDPCRSQTGGGSRRGMPVERVEVGQSSTVRGASSNDGSIGSTASGVTFAHGRQDCLGLLKGFRAYETIVCGRQWPPLTASEA
jgi:hypothetical protein